VDGDLFGDLVTQSRRILKRNWRKKD